MFVIEIAELKVLINNKYDFVKTVCKDYIADCSEFDFSVEISDKEIEKEMSICDSSISEGFAESVCLYRAIAEKLPEYDAFVLHGAAIKINNNAYIFAAKSGVGKTTHILNWKKVYRDKVTIINGDKPIIRFKSGIPYVYGTPWSGKEDFNTNTSAILKGIIFIERSENNSVEDIPNKNALSLLLNQLYFPSNAALKLKTIDLINNVFDTTNCWRLYCNRSVESAVTAYDAFFKEG
ncbi:MAG: hypothetical protein IJY88_07715 [Clostridia bacterium]|nr:hypothetical protein [Clostridia bacterium]